MKTLQKNNRNPKDGLRYENVLEALIDACESSNSNEIGVGNNTSAHIAFQEDETPMVVVRYYSTVVGHILSDDCVQIWDGNRWGRTTKTRLDWLVYPLGYRVTSINRKWKIYSISTGAYKDYMSGMVLTAGEF